KLLGAWAAQVSMSICIPPWSREGYPNQSVVRCQSRDSCRWMQSAWAIHQRGIAAKAALAVTALTVPAAERAMRAEAAIDMAARYRRIGTSSEGTRREPFRRGLVGGRSRDLCVYVVRRRPRKVPQTAVRRAIVAIPRLGDGGRPADLALEQGFEGA